MPSEVAQLQVHLRRLGRRLHLRAGIHLATRNLWLAATLTILIELAGRLWPISNRHLWAAAPLLLWFLGVSLYSLLRPLSLFQIARQVDTDLGLKDRLATALELEAWKFEDLENNPPSNLPTFQLLDALSVIEQISPHTLAWQIPKRPLYLAGGMLALGIGLAFFPNPDILTQRAAIQAATQKQAKAIQEARREFEKSTDPTAEERAKALQALAELMKQLSANPGDLEQALADLAQAEAKLHELQDSHATAQQTAAEQIATQLAELAQKNNQNSTATDAAAALTELAAALGALDSAKQQELAKAMEGLAAQAAPTDADLAQALSDLAAAARQGDMSEAAKAAAAANAAMARSNQAAKLQQALAQAQAQLAQSRQSIAQQGALAQGKGQGKNSGQNQGPGQGQAQGQNPGQGQGQGQQVGGGGGSNANQLPGANRTGAAGNPTQPNKPVSVTEAEKIYAPIAPQSAGNPEFIPGQETGEGQIINQQEPSPQGGINNRSLVPYQQVYQNYADAAAEAVDREQIPADMRDLVRDYFSQLAPE